MDPCLQHNGAEHHTDKYHLMKKEVEPRLVVRRGQPIRFVISTSRQYDHEKDGISFIFTVSGKDLLVTNMFLLQELRNK